MQEGMNVSCAEISQSLSDGMLCRLDSLVGEVNNLAGRLDARLEPISSVKNLPSSEEDEPCQELPNFFNATRNLMDSLEQETKRLYDILDRIRL